MVDDLRHLEVFVGLKKEIYDLLSEYNLKENGKIEKEELAALRLELNGRLTELLRHQRRALEFMIGKKVEPEMQFGEGVLIGRGG